MIMLARGYFTSIVCTLTGIFCTIFRTYLSSLQLGHIFRCTSTAAYFTTYIHVYCNISIPVHSLNFYVGQVHFTGTYFGEFMENRKI